MAKAQKNNKTKAEIKVNKFRRIHDVFLNNVNLHDVFINEIGSHALEYDQKTIDDIASSLKTKLKKKNNKYKLTGEAALEVYNTVHEKHPIQAILFYKNTLISIVTTFDNLLANIFRYYYTENTDKLSPDNKQISFFELRNLENIKDAEKFLIDREVEKILREEGLASKISMLKDVFNINFDSIRDYISEVEKIIKIRNLIVHNSGLADNEFISKYGDNKIKKGEKIKIEKEYVSHSLYLMYFFGSYILQDIQLRFSKEALTDSDFILNDVLHYLIQKKQLKFSRSVYDFIISNQDKIEDINKKMVVINYCISQKKQGKNNEHIQKILDIQDWSIKSDDFEMCKAALVGDDINFFKYLNILIKNKKINKKEINDWEIFDFYKSKKDFKLLSNKIKK